MENYRCEIICIVIFLLIAGLLALAAIITHSRRLRRILWYKSPFPERGGLFPLKGLAPFEAGIVMSVDIRRILAMYLMDLAISGLIDIEDPNIPSFAILDEETLTSVQKNVLSSFSGEEPGKRKKLLDMMDEKYNDLEKKIRSCNVGKTVSHYLEKVDSLWESLENATSISLQISIVEKEFPWLMLHEDAPDRLENMFSNTTSRVKIQPVVRIMRLLKQNVISNMELLKHASENNSGIFENRRYLDDIVKWAREETSTTPDDFDDYYWMGKTSRSNFEKKVSQSENRQKEILDLLDTIYKIHS